MYQLEPVNEFLLPSKNYQEKFKNRSLSVFSKNGLLIKKINDVFVIVNKDKYQFTKTKSLDLLENSKLDMDIIKPERYIYVAERPFEDDDNDGYVSTKEIYLNDILWLQGSIKITDAKFLDAMCLSFIKKNQENILTQVFIEKSLYQQIISKISYESSSKSYFPVYNGNL